ncbi:MAG: hypothetical protein J6V26_01455 [Alistipes sp.]|nr:hypothetical protein [Alistipes sp.]
MRKLIYILCSTLALLTTACYEGEKKSNTKIDDDVIAIVDGVELRIDDVKRDIPVGITGTDSVTFMRMYVENWVLNRLKMKRAEEVLTTSEDIERLVEGYRQSLMMRQLDQYYIDKTLDTEITDKQIAAYYRANSAAFKLDRNMVQGVVVKVPKSFRNTTTLTTAIRNSAKAKEWQELDALAEKHSLKVINMASQWVSYSDFLSNLPTERSRSYNDLITKTSVQQMTSDDALFYFIITDRALKGETAPLASVESDIRRRLFAERRAEVVAEYEDELKRESVLEGRVMVRDEVLLKSMSYTQPIENDTHTIIRNAEEEIAEEEPILNDTTTLKQ